MERITKVFSPSWLQRGPGYQEANQVGRDDESLLTGEKELPSEEDLRNPHRNAHTRTPWVKYAASIVLLVLYSVLLVSFVPRSCSDFECGKQTSVASPMNDAIEYVEFDFETEFAQESKYRGPPTQDLENAWESLLELDPVPFPEEQLRLVNRTNGLRNGDKLVRLDGGDKGPVAANFEVFHQLHCLNYIRQYTWRDWYFRHTEEVIIPTDMLTSDVGVRMHADHCIDYLRTSIMCHGDTTPFFTIADPDQSLGARGDFSAHHKCRSFDKLLAWTKDNSKDVKLSDR